MAPTVKHSVLQGKTYTLAAVKEELSAFKTTETQLPNVPLYYLVSIRKLILNSACIKQCSLELVISYCFFPPYMYTVSGGKNVAAAGLKIGEYLFLLSFLFMLIN